MRGLLVWSVLSLYQGVELNQPVMGAGFVVTWVQQRGTSDLPVFVFYIQRAGAPEDARTFQVEGLKTLREIRIHPGPFVAIAGLGRDTRPGIALVDGKTGTTVLQQECGDIVHHASGNLFLCRIDGQPRWSYSVTTGRVAPTLSAVEGALRVLSDGSLAARKKLLASLPVTRQLYESPEVRRAVVRELEIRVAEDKALAASSPLATRVRRASPERDYLGDLITTVARLRLDEAIPTLVMTDHTSVNIALTALGGQSLPFILRALRVPTPTGYSYLYRAELVHGLSR